MTDTDKGELEIEVVDTGNLALYIRAGFDGEVKVEARMEAAKAAKLLRQIADSIEEGAASGSALH